MKNKTYLFIQRVQFFFLFVLLFAALGCQEDEPSTEDLMSYESTDLTQLPFGGNDPTNILIRSEGDDQPDFLSLWLCGLPEDGAGANDAADWTNSDGTWDYTRKPQVEGSVDWMSEFDVSLDGNGKRIITGNALPDHPTGTFPIDPASAVYQYDRNPNEILAREILFEFPAIPEVADEPTYANFGRLVSH